MTYHDFVPEKFVREEGEKTVLHIKELRKYSGIPGKMAILRRVVRTRPFTRVVLPEDWKWA